MSSWKCRTGQVSNFAWRVSTGLGISTGTEEWQRVKDNILPLKSQTLRNSVLYQTLGYLLSLPCMKI